MTNNVTVDLDKVVNEIDRTLKLPYNKQDGCDNPGYWWTILHFLIWHSKQIAPDEAQHLDEKYRDLCICSSSIKIHKVTS